MSRLRAILSMEPTAGGRGMVGVVTRGARAVPARWLPTLSVLLFLVAVGLLAVRLSMVLNPTGLPDSQRWGMQDFRDAIYYPGVAVLDGNNPYDPISYMRTYPVIVTFPLYSPHALLLHLPFGVLSPHTARLLYFAFTLLMALVVSWLIVNLCGAPAASITLFGIAALLLLSRPGYQSVLAGQCTLQIVAGTYLALLYARRRPWLAGLGIALASIKPTFGVPLVLLLFVRRDFAALFRGVGIAGVLTACIVPVIAHAAGGFGALLATIPQNHETVMATDRASDASLSFSRIDAVALFARLLGQAPGPIVEATIGCVVLGIVALAVHRLAKVDPTRNTRPLSDALICLAVLACVYHQSYDLVLAAYPLAAASSGTLWPRQGRPERWMQGTVLVVLALLAANYLSTATVDELLRPSGAAWVVLASLNGLAVLSALLICVAVALRAATASQRIQEPVR